MAHENIKEKIKDLIIKLGFKDEEVEVSHNDDSIWFSIESPSARHLLNRDAEALIALNHLAIKMAEQMSREEEKYPRVIIDANGFEKKKIENLKTVAHMMAERARYFKSSIDVEPMSAHDRRIIHEHLSTFSDIKTESEGMGSGRHIVIKYIGGI